MSHFHNPIFLSLDVASAGAILAYWTDFTAHPVSTVSTALAGLWYAYCLYEAIEKRWKKRK